MHNAPGLRQSIEGLGVDGMPHRRVEKLLRVGLEPAICSYAGTTQAGPSTSATLGGSHRSKTKEHLMSLSGKLKSFLESPKGRRAVEKGRQQTAKPENRRKLQNLVNRVKKGR